MRGTQSWQRLNKTSESCAVMTSRARSCRGPESAKLEAIDTNKAFERGAHAHHVTNCGKRTHKWRSIRSYARTPPLEASKALVSVAANHALRCGTCVFSRKGFIGKNIPNVGSTVGAQLEELSQHSGHRVSGMTHDALVVMEPTNRLAGRSAPNQHKNHQSWVNRRQQSIKLNIALEKSEEWCPSTIPDLLTCS